MTWNIIYLLGVIITLCIIIHLTGFSKFGGSILCSIIFPITWLVVLVMGIQIKLTK